MPTRNNYRSNIEAEKARLEALLKSAERLDRASIQRLLSEVETELYLLALGQHWTQQDYPTAAEVAEFVQKRRAG